MFNLIIELGDQSTAYIHNGTTLNFEVGYIFNAISLKSTESFQLTTFNGANLIN